MCKKGTEHPNIELQEPDRLLHPEEYESEEEKPLLAVGKETQTIVLKILILKPILHVGTVDNQAIGLCIALWHNCGKAYSTLSMQDYSCSIVYLTLIISKSINY